MQTKWWRFTPRLGWMRCTETEGKSLREGIDRDPAKSEGYQVLEVEEAIDPAVIAAMARPVLLIHPDTLKAMNAAHPEMMPGILSAFPRMRVSEAVFAPPDKIIIMDQGPAFPSLIPIAWH